MMNTMNPISKLLAKVRSFYLGKRLGLVRGVSLGRHVLVIGKPVIGLVEGATIEIGDSAVVNSSNARYHLNMHSPVKLLADRPGAKIRIGASTRVHGTCIHAYRSVEIGANCLIAANSQIMDGNGHELSFDNVADRVCTSTEGRAVVIEDNVWVGANCIILPGVRIGAGSVIAAGSVVTRDVPPMVVAGGNPARVLRVAEQFMVAQDVRID